MKSILLVLRSRLAGLLTARREDPLPGSAEDARRPERQGTQSQFFRAQFGHDPRLTMKAISAARQWPERPGRHVVAFVHGEGVRVGGGALF